MSGSRRIDPPSWPFQAALAPEIPVVQHLREGGERDHDEPGEDERRRFEAALRGDPPQVLARVVQPPPNVSKSAPLPHEVVERICELVSRMMVSHPSSGASTVILVLREDHLPGVVVSLRRDADGVAVTFDCNDAEPSWTRLDAASQGIAESLASRLGQRVRVTVRMRKSPFRERQCVGVPRVESA